MGTLHRYRSAQTSSWSVLGEVLAVCFLLIAAALIQSNRFLDRRIGEYDANMTPEDRMIQRFMKEKKVMLPSVDRSIYLSIYL